MGELKLPHGFRFHPTDDELVLHYLCRKCASQPISVPIIAELDLYKFDPWQLPGMAFYGENEWYFFSPRNRKYPNGSRPNRSAGSGYWKATGVDKPIKPKGSPKALGIKKALVFYIGKAPKGEKTNWIMHEYRLANVDRSANKKNGLRLDDWVLCRIYNKKGGLNSTKPHGPPKRSEEEQKLNPTDFARFDPSCFGASESFLSRQITESSCLEHVLSPDLTCEREVQSQARPSWRRDLQSPLHIPLNYMDAIEVDGWQLSPVFRDPLQEIQAFLQKPF